MTLGTTVNALLDRTRRDSLLASRGPVHTLGAAYTAGGSTLTLAETPTHIGIGEILSVDYELFYVQSVDSGTKTITVIPGYFGTTQANHALAAVLEVAPRFPKAALLDAAEHEIRSWGTELWRTTTVVLPLTTVERTYDLDTASGPDISVTASVRASNVVTATVPVGHGIFVGDVVIVDVATASFDGTFTVTSRTATTIVWSQTGADDTGGSGVLRRKGPSVGDVHFLLDVRMRPIGTSTNFWNFSWTMDAWPHLDARLVRMNGNTNFPSGTGIQFLRPPSVGSDAQVTMAQPFVLGALTSGSDLVDDVGVRAEWFDILESGIKMRSLEGVATGRSDWRTGNLVRDDNAVSALDTVRIVSQFRDTRQLRLARAALDLRSEFPYRRLG